MDDHPAFDGSVPGVPPGAAGDAHARVTDARILVVDDVPANVDLMGALLRSAGFTDIVGVSEASSVIPTFREVWPDLVLLDLHMPGSDGVELLAQLRSLAAGVFVPMVMVTADATDDARSRSLAAGATDFLTKPVDRLELVLRCSNMLETRMLYKRLADDHETLRRRMREQLVVDLTASKERRQAVERIEGVLGGRYELSVHFQPIVDISTRETVGFEALARFPDHLGRSPDVWFADAERLGLGEALELFAASQAMTRLMDIGPTRFLSVNVSPRTACSRAFAEMMAGEDSSRIVVELTEHTPHLDTVRLRESIDALRELGIRVAMDDAGAGFSGLQRLLALRPEMVKLDRDITERVVSDSAARILLASLVAFCDETNAFVVVEGIEREETAEVAHELGVRHGQGYLFGRPAPLDAGEASARR